MSVTYKMVFDEAVKPIKFIKFPSLSTCLFSILCDEMRRIRKTHLLHMVILWFSQGIVLV